MKQQAPNHLLFPPIVEHVPDDYEPWPNDLDDWEWDDCIEVKEEEDEWDDEI